MLLPSWPQAEVWGAGGNFYYILPPASRAATRQWCTCCLMLQLQLQLQTQQAEH